MDGEYFDAFLYLANWGTRVLKLALPANVLDATTARRFCAGESPHDLLMLVHQAASP